MVMVGGAQDRPVLVLDNGAGWIKAGLVRDRHQGVSGIDAEPTCVPHCSVKSSGEKFTRFGEPLDAVKDITGMTIRRPFDRGYLANADLERDIWSGLFSRVLKVGQTSECDLLLTEPLMNLPVCRASMEQIVFEDFGFASYCAVPAPALAARHHFAQTAGVCDASKAGTCMVLDVGHSFTHAVPIYDGRVIGQGVKRLDFGGKAATNLMKELVSYRSLNVMNETYIVEYLKEKACFVSGDAAVDLKATRKDRKKFAVEYVLPDNVDIFRPQEKEQKPGADQLQAPVQSRYSAQSVILNHERFMVPEVFFTPADVGIKQAGIAEVVMQAVEETHKALHELQLSNVLLVGGSSQFPGFVERFRTELRKVAPSHFPVNVHVPENPLTCAWHGGKMMACTPDFSEMATTKQDYEEHGCSPDERKFYA